MRAMAGQGGRRMVLRSRAITIAVATPGRSEAVQEQEQPPVHASSSPSAKLPLIVLSPDTPSQELDVGERGREGESGVAEAGRRDVGKRKVEGGMQRGRGRRMLELELEAVAGEGEVEGTVGREVESHGVRSNTSAEGVEMCSGIGEGRMDGFASGVGAASGCVHANACGEEGVSAEVVMLSDSGSVGVVAEGGYDEGNSPAADEADSRARKYSRLEKGKAAASTAGEVGVDGEAVLFEGIHPAVQGGDVAQAGSFVQDEEAGVDPLSSRTAERERRMEAARARNYNIALRRASHFARFREEVPQQSGARDWPGPFSVARQLVEQRAEAASQRAACEGVKGRALPALVSWEPSRKENFVTRGNLGVLKSLHDLSVNVLCEYFEHVEDLGVLPDESLRKICSRLCAMRKMCPRVLRLLIAGGPQELVIPNCTSCKEEEFAEAVASLSTQKLQVLELGMCGRVFSDKLVNSFTLGRCFPLLRSLTLKGAYRLTDVGLIQFLKASPVLTSLELQQCNAISEQSIVELSRMVGSRLQLLSLEGCDQLDGMSLVPSLSKLEELRRLNLSCCGGVSDQMVEKLMIAVGSNLKELRLADCTSLTDLSLVSIATSCPTLEILDLDNVTGLTDASLAAIVNGGLRLQRLHLKRGTFSDGALAALVSTLDGCLRELSLNSVRQAADQTLLALAQHTRSCLEVLDASWCRKISDQALGYLADSCSDLKELLLYGCSQVTNLFLHGHSNVKLRVIK